MLVTLERLLAGGESLQHQPRMVDLSIDQARLHELSPFNKAAFALFRTGLQRLDELTRKQFDTVINITDPGTSTSQSALSSKPSDKQGSGLLPDTDSIIAAISGLLETGISRKGSCDPAAKAGCLG